MKHNLKRLLCLIVSGVLVLMVFPGVQFFSAIGAEEGLIRGTFRFAGMYNHEVDTVAEFAYSDDYFTEDASVYQPSLATMSLCFELSSWSSREKTEWTEKTVNAQNLLKDTGFVDFDQNIFWNDSPTLESIGAVIAKKQLEDATLIALAVRGGGYYNEWGSNFLVGGKEAHEGFATARDHVVSFLRDYIEKHAIEGRVKLWLVGFSRGGAVANMTAGYLNENALAEGVSLVPADLYCYTFEAPQGAVEISAADDLLHGNIHNIINPNDVVPLVAPGEWGFKRYNTTSHLLPTISTVRFPAARDEMLRQYEKVLEGVEVTDEKKAAYNIAEYAKTLQLKVNWLSFLPGGDPFVEVNVLDDMHLPLSVMLVDFVDALSNAMGTRDDYHELVENDLVLLLNDLLGVGAGKDISAYLEETVGILAANRYEKLIEILSPILQLNFKSFSQRKQEVAQRFAQIIPQPEGYSDILGSVSALVNAMADMIVNDTDTLLNLVVSFMNSSIMQSHYPEVTLAWMRAADPLFSDAPISGAVPETMRIVRVNCPVDIEIYNADSLLIASIRGGVCESADEAVGCAVNEEGEMVIYLPADALYSIRVIATGEGGVHCSINEFNVARGRYSQVINYGEVLVQKGNQMTAVLPALDPSQYTDPSAKGSDADYRLMDQNGNVIPPSDTLRGDDVAKYTVAVDRNNENGQVLGGGSYVKGSFAQVTAYPLSGCEFLGWYVNDVFVTGDTVYRFRVEEDVTAVAHFGDVSRHMLYTEATEGGIVHNANVQYTPGSIVMLSATPDEGYMLKEWQTSAGALQTTEDEITYLIMPDCDVTVKAVFVEAGFVCRGCNTLLPKGVSHLAPCGYLPHFICDDDYYAGYHVICPICENGYACLSGHGYDEGECGYVEPTPVPTEEPTPVPTEEPTPVPTEEPTPEPTP